MLPDPLALVGATIADKYLVESVVGEGGFAVVYRASHLVWNRPVALKVFKALGDVSAARRQQLLDDFVREGSLLVELSERSTAIVQARDVGMLTLPQGEEVPFMVLEWLDGETLESLIHRETAEGVAPRSLDEAIELLGPVAEALALAHQKGIAHRDVKPGNVFVVGDPHGDYAVKLLDFGIAKVVQEAAKAGFRKTTGQSSYTPLYAAPEQFDRSLGATGPWTDVFAFALVFVEVLLGHEALEGDSLLELARVAANERVRPSPRGLGLEVSDAVEGVFLRALAVSPEARYQDVGEFWVALRFSLELGPPSGFTLASARNRTPPRRPARERSVAPPETARAPAPAGSLALGLAQTAVMPGAPSLPPPRFSSAPAIPVHGSSPLATTDAVPAGHTPDARGLAAPPPPALLAASPAFVDPRAARGLVAVVVALVVLFLLTGAFIAAVVFDKI